VLTELELAVWHVLLRYMSYYGKRYGFPSQATIVRKCEKWYGVQMCRRTLNRVLASLEAKGFFVRTCRHSKKSTGELWLRSTLYTLCSKSFSFLDKMQRVAKGFLNLLAVPKMAQYSSSSEGRSLSPVDNRVESGRAWEEGAARSGPINLTFRTI